MAEEVSTILGPIDVLVNNAGIIKVGPFAEMDTEDFERAMNVMFWGPLYAVQAVLPSMRERRHGRIVNITSIGGKVTIPHLLPYCCAKFAAVALSEGLRTELGPEGISVTTIVPGLLRTGSHLNVELTGEHAAEYAWFAAGATTPLVSISASRAARSIVRAAARGECEKILSVPADLLARFHGIVPGLSGELMRGINRLLPAAGTHSRDSRTGYEVERGINSTVWKMMTIMGRRAAASLNELRGPRLIRSAGA
jgi:NAD(P)-dependent dehydrogenase (short-subunit alcohol dehydrogenase family)